MTGLRRLKYLKPRELEKVFAVINDPKETREKRADAALLLRMHLSLKGARIH